MSKNFNKIIHEKPWKNSGNENDLFAANFSFIARDSFYLFFGHHIFIRNFYDYHIFL